MHFDILSFFLLFVTLGNLVPTGTRTVASSVCSSILAESRVPDSEHPDNHGDVRYKRWYTRSDPKVWELADFVLIGKSRKPHTEGSVAGATANSASVQLALCDRATATS